MAEIKGSTRYCEGEDKEIDTITVNGHKTAISCREEMWVVGDEEDITKGYGHNVFLLSYEDLEKIRNGEMLAFAVNHGEYGLYVAHEETVKEGFPVHGLIIATEATEEIFRIGVDGTVTVSKEGGNKEAAKIFYESLQIEGQTLHQKIADLEAEIKSLKSEKQD